MPDVQQVQSNTSPILPPGQGREPPFNCTPKVSGCRGKHRAYAGGMIAMNEISYGASSGTCRGIGIGELCRKRLLELDDLVRLEQPGSFTSLKFVLDLARLARGFRLGQIVRIDRETAGDDPLDDGVFITSPIAFRAIA